MDKQPIEKAALLLIDIQDSFKTGTRWERRSSTAFEGNVTALLDQFREDYKVPSQPEEPFSWKSFTQESKPAGEQPQPSQPEPPSERARESAAMPSKRGRV